MDFSECVNFKQPYLKCCCIIISLDDNERETAVADVDEEEALKEVLAFIDAMTA